MEIEGKKRLIKVKDLAADLLVIYYQYEIRHIPEPELKSILRFKRVAIRNVAFNTLIKISFSLANGPKI